MSTNVEYRDYYEDLRPYNRDDDPTMTQQDWEAIAKLVTLQRNRAIQVLEELHNRTGPDPHAGAFLNQKWVRWVLEHEVEVKT